MLQVWGVVKLLNVIMYGLFKRPSDQSDNAVGMGHG